MQFNESQTHFRSSDVTLVRTPHISLLTRRVLCVEMRKIFLFPKKFFLCFHMWGRKRIFSFFSPCFIRPNENMISFFTILLFMPFPFASLARNLTRECQNERNESKKKVLFHFLMHGKSNGSRHFYAPSIQHQINMKFMLSESEGANLPIHPQPTLNAIPSVYSTSKRISNAILTCVYVKY